MFTGLISEVGIVKRRNASGRAERLTIDAPLTVSRVKPGDSVAVAGACLTVEEIVGGAFTCSVIPETLRATRLGKLKPGDMVNLELPIGPNEVFGGHVVTGHVDVVGRVTNVQRTGDGGRVRISHPQTFNRWVVDKGSIAVDGISLTVAERHPGGVTIGIIPTTWQNTTIGRVKAGDPANLEFDYLVKTYTQHNSAVPRSGKLTEDALHRAGW